MQFMSRDYDLWLQQLNKSQKPLLVEGPGQPERTSHALARVPALDGSHRYGLPHFDGRPT